MKNIFIMIFLILAFSLEQSSFAQPEESAEPASEVKSQWQVNLDIIKEETNKLIDEHNALRDQHEALRAKLSSLEAASSQQKAKRGKILKNNQRLEVETEEQVRTLNSLQEETDALQKEILVQASANEALNEKLTEQKESGKLLETKLSELELKKKEMLLDLKLEEAMRDEGGTEGRELNNLKKDLSGHEKKEQTLAQSIKETKEKSVYYNEQVVRISRENKELEKQIAQLQKRKGSVKSPSMEEPASVIPADQLKEKKQLEARIQQMGTQLEQLQASVRGSSEMLERKRNLISQIMTLDEENQKLRDRVMELKNKLESP